MSPSIQQSLISALQPLCGYERCGEVMRRECDRVIGALEEGEREKGEEGRRKVKKRRRTRKWTWKCVWMFSYKYYTCTCRLLKHMTIMWQSRDNQARRRRRKRYFFRHFLYLCFFIFRRLFFKTLLASIAGGSAMRVAASLPGCGVDGTEWYSVYI